MPTIPSIPTILANPRNWQFPVSLPADFNQAVEQLFCRLEETHSPYTLVGGIAMLSHLEGRNTVGIDFIMHRADADAIGLVVAQADQHFARASFQSIPVGLLLSSNALFQSVQSHHSQLLEFAGRSIRVATPLGLCILKLFALPSLYRQGQFNRAALYETDTLQPMLAHNIDLEQAVQAVALHVIDSDRTELDTIAVDIVQRMRRMHNHTPPSTFNH